MAFSIKTKQVAAVTAIVGLAVVSVSAWYVSSLARVWLVETEARAELLAQAIYHRMNEVVRLGGDPANALRNDEGLSSILQASLYSTSVMYAAIVDTRGLIINHSDRARVDTRLDGSTLDLSELVNADALERARVLWQSEAYYEYRFPLLLRDGLEGGQEATDFGVVRVGISLPVLRQNLAPRVREVAITTGIAILAASLVAMLLAQLTLRPIHMIRSGLARLGRGETDVDVELPNDAELAALGDSFKAVSARLAADRSALDGHRATLESVVDNLEDAVALFGPDGALLFANPAMEAAFAAPGDVLDQVLPKGHPYRLVVEQVLAGSKTTQPPTRVQIAGGSERLVLAHSVKGDGGRLFGVMLVARNLTYLSQVESTLSYSRKLAALGRLSAGIAHEVKNPLNATMIHLELLRMQLAGRPEALEHVATIASQVRRLDEVVQGFLKFTRPEDLRLQAVNIPALVRDLMPVVRTEADSNHVDVRLEFPADLPAAHADPGLLQQAFLNLALNACQAMPEGGRLRIAGSLTSARQIAVVFEDSGVGISPQDLSRIFDLYFTTKAHGSGIGLSLVYRTVQLHDGDIEVQSVPGRGTTFRVLLPEAPVADGRQAQPRAILGLKPDVAALDRPVSAS